MARSVAVAFAVLLFVPFVAPAEDAGLTHATDLPRRYYSGTVGRAAVLAYLEFDGVQVEGRYSYGFIAENDAAALVLRGTLAPDGTVTLDEWASEVGSPGPIRTGQLKGRATPDRLRISGEWVGTDGKRLPFTVDAYARVKRIHRSAPEIGVGLPDIVDRSPLAVLASRTLTVDAERRVAEATARGARFGADYEITYFSHRLISVVASFGQGDTRSAGKEGFVFANTPGGPKRLALGDVLRAGAPDRLAARALEEHKRIQFTTIGYSPPRVGAWCIVGRGALQVYLEPADERGTGPSPVTISMNDAAGLLDPAGPLGFLLEPKRRPRRRRRGPRRSAREPMRPAILGSARLRAARPNRARASCR
jgi:hypothetical protein